MLAPVRFIRLVTYAHISRGGAVWSARVAHNHKVVGSNPTPATKKKRLPFGSRFFFALYG